MLAVCNGRHPFYFQKVSSQLKKAACRLLFRKVCDGSTITKSVNSGPNRVDALGESNGRRNNEEAFSEQNAGSRRSIPRFSQEEGAAMRPWG